MNSYSIMLGALMVLSALIVVFLVKRRNNGGQDPVADRDNEYSRLFDNMMHGFIYCRVLFDDNNEAYDYLYLRANQLYEKFIGLHNVEGKKLSDVLPGLRQADPELFRRIGRIALSGEPEKFETFVQALDQWYSVSMYCPQKGYFVALVDNITELKRAKENNAFFLSVVNSSDDAILSKTLEGIITTWNKAAERLFGYTEEEIVGKHVSILIPEERQDEEPIIIERITRGERINHYETQRLRKDGTRFYISLTVSPITDSNGTIIGASKIARDISEKYLAAQKLEASEKRFRALIENSYDAIVLSDADSRILYQSPSVSRILGYSAQERSGRQVHEYLHPDDKENFGMVYQKVITTSGTPIPFQYRFRRKDENYIWLEGMITNHIDDPNVKAIVANYRDVTVRKEALESLELMVNRFRQAQQIAHLGHWVLNMATQKTYWSDETYNILHLEHGQVEPSEEVFFSLIHPDDVQMVKETITIATERLSPFSLYHRILTPTGAVRILFAMGRFEFDSSDKPINLYGTLLDVTELTEKEQKLEEAKKDLETFIYRSSHDLKSPIATILGLINVAKAEIKDNRSLLFFNMIHEIVLRQNKMLLNLIEVTSVPDREIVPDSFTGAALLDATFNLLKQHPRFSNASFNLIDAARNLYTDFHLCVVILFQILENSLVFGKDRSRINIKFEAVMEGTMISITDNGIGIEDEYCNRVFEMFFRGSELSTGSGLGLYLAKKAVERLGGDIKVTSIPGQGTEFYVTIPDFKSVDEANVRTSLLSHATVGKRSASILPN